MPGILTNLLKQKQFIPMPVPIQVFVIYAGTSLQIASFFIIKR